MRLLFIFFLSVPFFHTAWSQNLEGIKIEEVTAYIRKADHPMIVNFWATWCKPCIEEMPALQAAARQYKDSGVELILISLDFPEAFPGAIADFIKKKRLNGTFFWLDETNADHFCPAIDNSWQGSIPATLFISNKNSYRRFYERKVEPAELNKEVKAMLQ